MHKTRKPYYSTRNAQLEIYIASRHHACCSWLAAILTLDRPLQLIPRKGPDIEKARRRTSDLAGSSVFAGDDVHKKLIEEGVYIGTHFNVACLESAQQRLEESFGSGKHAVPVNA